MFIIDDILAAQAAGKLLPWLIGGAAAVSVGFAAAELYEHKVPWGLSHKLAGAVQARDKAKGEQRKAEDDSRLWAQAYRSEKLAVTRQNASIQRLGDRAAAWQRSAQAATAEAHKANLSAQAAAAAFMQIKPKGATACERDHDMADIIRRDVQ